MEKSMDFTGSGLRLTQDNLVSSSKRIGVEVAALKAVVAVEARSRGFDNRNRPVILFEPHIFYRKLGAGAQRDRAKRAGLAYRSQGTRPYPNSQDDRYEQLKAAMKINRVAALEAASWGLGQVMGFNWKFCGYSSIDQFIEAMLSGEVGQLDAMLRYIKARKLIGHIKAKRWALFAEGYNGSNYVINAYDRKLAREYSKAKGATPAADPMLDGVLSIGEKGASIVALQRDLKMLGFQSVPDGDFGPFTKRAVEAFQERYGLAIDGRAGPKTLAAIEVEIQSIETKPVPVPPVKPRGKSDWEALLSFGRGVLKLFQLFIPKR